MKILYLIGNGFDLNLDLKTSYNDFYKKYIKTKSKNEIIANFKKELKTSLKSKVHKWADFEYEFGKYSKSFKNESEYLNLYDDIVDALAKHIDTQNVDFDLNSKDAFKLKNDLYAFEQYFTNLEKEKYLEYRAKFLPTNYEVNVINFNYTNTFEKLFDFKGIQIPVGSRSFNGKGYNIFLKSVHHIHGYCSDNMVLGVYEHSQIANELFRENEDVDNALVKNTIYRNIGHLIDKTAMKLIEEADVICVFGMSFGKTDNGWWKLIGQKLSHSQCPLIIFAKSHDDHPIQRFRNQSDKNKIINKFLSHSNFNEQEKELIKSKIIVCLDTKMFKFVHDSKIKKTEVLEKFYEVKFKLPS